MSTTSDCPIHDCRRSDHTECWREYDRRESERKYARLERVF